MDSDIPTNLSDKTQIGFVKWVDLKQTSNDERSDWLKSLTEGQQKLYDDIQKTQEK